MNQMTSAMVRHDILSDEFKADPYPTFRWWHAHGTAFRDPTQNYWISFNYRQIRDLLRDSRLTVERYDHIPVAEEQEYDRFIRNFLSVWMLNVDGEAHVQARNTLKPLFSTRALADYELLIRDQVERCLSMLGTAGEPVEAYRQIAFPLPARVVLSIMGLDDLPDDQLERVRRFSDVISTYVGSAGRAPGCIRPTYDVLHEFCDFLKENIRPDRPGFDRTLTARLLDVYGKGTSIAESPETLSNIILFIVSGFETTTNLILNTLLAVGRTPSLEDDLRADPGLIKSFVDETLRIYPPVNRTARKARADIGIDGGTIKAGDLLILFLGAANRDPSVFPDPDTFRILRPERQEFPALSFGHGPHLCIGRLLSILEVCLLYERLLDRYRRLEVDLGSVRWRDGSVLKGISTLHFSAHV